MDVGVLRADDGKQRRHYLLANVGLHWPGLNLMAHGGMMLAEYAAPVGTPVESIVPRVGSGFSYGVALVLAAAVDHVVVSRPEGKSVGVKARVGLGLGPLKPAGLQVGWAHQFAALIPLGTSSPSPRPAQLAAAIRDGRAALKRLAHPATSDRLYERDDYERLVAAVRRAEGIAGTATRDRLLSETRRQ
jgi:hypothetical protein